MDIWNKLILKIYVLKVLQSNITKVLDFNSTIFVKKPFFVLNLGIDWGPGLQSVCTWPKNIPRAKVEKETGVIQSYHSQNTKSTHLKIRLAPQIIIITL